MRAIIILVLFLAFTSVSSADSLRKSRFIDPNYQDIIQKVSTVVEAQIACENRAVYKPDREQFVELDYWQSIKCFWDTKSGDCEDGAFAIAAMLHDNSYPIVFMYLYTRSSSHIVFIYHKNGGYGSAGIVRSDLRLPVYPSIQSLAKTFSGNGKNKIIGYALLRLHPTPENIQKFITSGDNLKKEPIWIRGPYHKLTK